MKKRVVVTGMGAITPIGLSVEEFWENVKKGVTGFDFITKFDASEYKCKLAAEVKGFEGKNYMDFKAAKRMELFSQYAVAASKEALEDALSSIPNISNIGAAISNTIIPNTLGVSFLVIFSYVSLSLFFVIRKTIPIPMPAPKYR